MPIRVLIVDDSRTIRGLLRVILSQDPDIAVVGEAADPYEARAAIKELDPDVITLDVEMPRMDGLEFLGHLMRLRPMPVVMVSSLTQKSSVAAIRALSLGAIECIDRADIRNDIAGGAYLCMTVKMAARARVLSTGERRTGAITRDFLPNGKMLMIGSSTGGVDALERVFSNFPENCPPTLVSQHMPQAFLTSFAQRLDDIVRPRVRLAEDGMPLDVGTILLAPGGRYHATVSGSGPLCVNLVGEDGSHAHMPSVDVMFAGAVPRAPDTVAVLLTGMGRDGADGMLRLRQAGATTIAQSGRTAVIDGMPRAARENGAAKFIVDLDEMWRELLVTCGSMRSVA